MKISEMPVGEYLVFGQFLRSDERTPVNLLWRKASEQNEFYANDGIGKFCADAQEPENESRDRRERGSNFFPQTNICQFLNAVDDDWFKPQHEKDVADNNLKNCPGFLNLFEAWERKMITPHEIVTSVPVGFKRKYGEQVKTTLKVSMLSRSQLYGGEEPVEGEQLSLFARGATTPVNLMLRTAVNTGLCAIDRRGRFTNHCPATEFNIVPFLRLDDDCNVEFSPLDGFYYILPPEEVLKEITDELHRLLK